MASRPLAALAARSLVEPIKIFEPKSPAEARDALEIKITPLGKINYGLLHNRGPLFETFTVKKKKASDISFPTLSVQVTVAVGTHSFLYRSRFDMSAGAASPPLLESIRVGLMWDYLSQFRDPVQTSVHVELWLGTYSIYEDTLPTIILPIEEWEDTKATHPWLPSYVRPKDPAIEQLMVGARRYYKTIKDDPSCGFVGYGSGECIIPQLHAIWSCLVFDYDLSYIGPSAATEKTTQHLRTPSEILRTRQGTCIDLALMFAAALEYIDVYPVLFLFAGHACVGVWTKRSDHDAFALGDPVNGVSVRTAADHPWIVPVDANPGLIALVSSAAIVPVETTWLCARSGL